MKKILMEINWYIFLWINYETLSDKYFFEERDRKENIDNEVLIKINDDDYELMICI